MRAIAKPVLVLVAALIAVVARLVRLRPRDTASEIARQPRNVPPVLLSYVQAVTHAESEADATYRSAIEQLRADPNLSANAITEAYRAIQDDDPALREPLVMAAADLVDPAILQFLVAVASTESLPSVRAHADARGEEASKLRLLAVDGIEALAGAQNAEAWDALQALTMSSDRAVQAAAVVAMTHGEPGPERRARLEETVPADRRYLLGVRRRNISEVPQIKDPTAHLARFGGQPAPAVPPDPDKPTSGQARPSAATRIPKVSETESRETRTDG